MAQLQRPIVPCLWFDGQAEEAAHFYVTLLPDSGIEEVQRSPVDTPGAATGGVLTVAFRLGGMRFLGLNAGPQFPFTEAISFQIMCEDQAEVDRLWAAFSKDGAPSACGWIKDRWGLSWQIVPTRMMALLSDPDRGRARRAMEAMMQMGKLDIAALDRAADAG